MARATANNAPYWAFFNETDWANYENKQNLEYKKNQDALLKKQTEDDLLRQEQEFIKNFKFQPQAEAATLKTPKYGDVDFSSKQVAIGERLSASPGVTAGIQDFTNQKNAEKAKLDQEKDNVLKELQARWSSNALSQEDYLAQRTSIVQGYNAKERELNNKYNALSSQQLAANKQKAQEYTPYTYELVSSVNNKKQTFVFLPEDFVLKGANGPGGYHYNTAFLNTKTWEDLFTMSQPMDVSSLGINAGDTALGRGFLFSQEDWNNFKSSKLNGNFKINTFTGTDMAPDNLPILGIANVNGELKYVRETGYKVGKKVATAAYIDSNGNILVHSKTEHSGIRGVAQDFSETVASVPFLPEFVGIATGNPALYASLKGLQTAGMGGDLGDAFKSMALSYATASVTASLGTYGEAIGKNLAVTANIPAGVANAIGGAVVHATFNGTMAAITGGDVEKAMIVGAIGGGAQASAADFTNTVFGGEANVQTLASSVNLTTKQVQHIFTGAVAQGAIAEAVQGTSFMDAFTTSLITQGMSTASANYVAKNLDKNLSPAMRQTITKNTQMFVAASARAAVRGEDMETAIKAVAPRFASEIIGTGAREALKGT